MQHLAKIIDFLKNQRSCLSAPTIRKPCVTFAFAVELPRIYSYEKATDSDHFCPFRFDKLLFFYVILSGFSSIPWNFIQLFIPSFWLLIFVKMTLWKLIFSLQIKSFYYFSIKSRNFSLFSWIFFLIRYDLFKIVKRIFPSRNCFKIQSHSFRFDIQKWPTSVLSLPTSESALHLRTSTPRTSTSRGDSRTTRLLTGTA